LPRSTEPEGHALCAGVVFTVELGRAGKLSGGDCVAVPDVAGAFEPVPDVFAGPGNPVCVGNGNPVELGSEVGFATLPPPDVPAGPVDVPTVAAEPPVPIEFEAPGNPVCVGDGNPVELGSVVGFAGAFEVPAAGLVLVANVGPGFRSAVAP